MSGPERLEIAGLVAAVLLARRPAPVAAGGQRLRHRVLRRRRAQRPAGRLPSSSTIRSIRQASSRSTSRRSPSGSRRLFAKVLGFSGWTIHLPQALAGIASVALLYRLVRPPFGASAAIVAALVMAVMPVARRDRPLQQRRFLAGILPAAGGRGGRARPRRVAGRGDGAAGRGVQRQDAGGAGLRPGAAGRLAGSPARSTGAGGSAGWRRPGMTLPWCRSPGRWPST